MIEPARAANETSEAFVALYDAHVGRVYSYLHRRCSDRPTAEELTSETFLSALHAMQRNPPRSADESWLLAIARHKLVDHWRRRERDERNLRAVAGGVEIEEVWDQELDSRSSARPTPMSGPMPTSSRSSANDWSSRATPR